MKGKIALVTGGTNGIGKQTAIGLARLGATVVIVGRDAQKTARVLEEIRSVTGNAQVTSLLADLSSQADIRHLAGEFKAQFPQLHVLVNNAGGIYDRRELTVDGIERTFAFNHLAYFLLTNLLLETLKASTPARIVNVSSAAHFGAKLDFDNLQLENGYTPFGAYGISKLANLLFTSELARRLQGSGVTVNALHPGVVNTGIGMGSKNWFLKIYQLLLPLFSTTPEKGAQTSIYLASSPKVEGISGQYFSNSKPARSDPRAVNPELARKLWEVSAKMVGL